MIREEETSFQEVLDELREELARHYLSTTDYTSSEISFCWGMKNLILFSGQSVPGQGKRLKLFAQSHNKLF
jgi:AraC-like DNA-binding protein